MWALWLKAGGIIRIQVMLVRAGGILLRRWSEELAVQLINNAPTESFVHPFPLPLSRLYIFFFVFQKR